MPGHPPDLAGHLDGRRLPVGASHGNDGLRIGRIIFRGELGEQAPRLGVGEMRHAVNVGFLACHDRDSTTIDRFGDEILAVEPRALEGPEHASGGDLAMVDGEPGHV